MPKVLIAVAALIPLAACAGTPQSTEAAYRCGGERIATRFVDEAVEVTRGGDTRRLPQTRSASGARFEAGEGGGRMLVWDRGARARLEVGERTYPECRRLKAATPASLQGGEWVVEDIDGRGVIDIARASMRFDEDGRVAGLATCNRYSGKFTLTHGMLRAGPLIATRKACPPALMNQESAFFAVVNNATTAEIDSDGALFLTATDGTTLTARR